MTILAYTDGASRGNPGESGIGVILKDESGNLLAEHYGYIGRTTNNIAEYTALASCLKLVKKMECKTLIVHSDSELMVRQLNGAYKVKDEGIQKHYRRVRKLLEELPVQFEIRHIPREKNREADRLANRGIDSKKRFKMQ
jgi:ribonuclease HI